MSQQQFFDGTSLPSTANIEFVRGNDGIAVPPNPATHILDLQAGASSINNTAGITAIGNAGGFTETITLTNRLAGTTQTLTNTTNNLIVFTTPNIAGVYDIEVDIAVYDTTIPLGPIAAVYHLSGTVQADGAGALASIGIPTISVDGNIAYVAELVDVALSGLNIEVQVTGIAVSTARWTGLLTYLFGGA